MNGFIHSVQTWPCRPSPSLPNARAWWISASAIWTIQWESSCANPKTSSTYSPCWRRSTWRCGRASPLPSPWWASWSFCSGVSRPCAARTAREAIRLRLCPRRFRAPSGSSTALSCSKVGDMLWTRPRHHPGTAAINHQLVIYWKAKPRHYTNCLLFLFFDGDCLRWGEWKPAWAAVLLSTSPVVFKCETPNPSRTKKEQKNNEKNRKNTKNYFKELETEN